MKKTLEILVMLFFATMGMIIGLGLKGLFTIGLIIIWIFLFGHPETFNSLFLCVFCIAVILGTSCRWYERSWMQSN